MTIAYKNKRLFTNLSLGIIWTMIGISNFYFGSALQWYPYALLVLGVVYISLFIFEYVNKYVIITDEKIQVNSLPKIEINLCDIKEVNYYADDYTFKTPARTLKILRSQIAPHDLSRFEVFYEQLREQLKK